MRQGMVISGPLSQRKKQTSSSKDANSRTRTNHHNKPLDHHIRKGEILAEDTEISVKNESNISQLSDGRIMVGVGHFSISRGMHIGNVSHVILFGDTPSSSEFVHCAGRTGRMGNDGEVFVLFPPSSGRACQQICQCLEIPFQMTRRSVIDRLLKMEDFFEEDALRLKQVERAERLAKRAAAAAESRDNLFSMLEEDEVPQLQDDNIDVENSPQLVQLPANVATSSLDDEEASKKLANHQRAVSDVLSDQYSDPMMFMPLDTQIYLRELMSEEQEERHYLEGAVTDLDGDGCAHHNHL
eukprot:TRINITY_DN50426_c0_g1_i1.p1 TRINITY_DN50426_c0_g1~~TRINITY_DN50426_c0_g1_i1.p1  ORF type:complete len:298 (-),score=40.55 TRINITY_DN50426_c0_g1_i1:234-1127(-)